MPDPDQIYHGSIKVMSLLFIVLGTVVLAVTINAGGAGFTLGMLIGPVFILVGIGRLYLANRMSK